MTLMILLADLDFSLPLTHPVIIFSLVLFIILFAPILLKKIKVPHIIGLILAGVVVGPYALNLLKRDSSIVLFGTVGLLYIHDSQYSPGSDHLVPNYNCCSY